MTRVVTGSRLHFGLLRPPPAGDRRGFGGCGLMIEAPAVRVAVEPAAEWSAIGPSADRALAVAQRIAPDRPHRVVVEVCPAEHVGLGVGTQLSLAVARAVTGSLGGPVVSAADLARLSGRGGRSGVGVHGFEQGGFIVDGGRRAADGLAPLVARAEFPPDWRIVLLRPPGPAVWHGARERAAFAAMTSAASDDSLCRLVLLGMLPALAEREPGSIFRGAVRVQHPGWGGVPSGPGRTVRRRGGGIDCLVRGQGIAGVGQSSWGPTTFAVVGDADRAAAIACGATAAWLDIGAVVATGRNCGAG